MAQTPQTSSQDAPLSDPTALARFGKLEVVARMLVEGFMVGQHESPFKGSSVDFVEHRQYTSGDDTRHIDWRVYGKTGKYYVKEYEDESNLRCHLLVDCSGSMAYSKSTLSKFEYARCLASALGYLLLRQRDAAGLFTFDTELRDRVEPSANLVSFQHLVETLERRQPGKESALADVLIGLLPTIRRRSLIVLLSDCFDRLEPLARALERYRHARHEVILFHIVAPEEEEFPFSRPTQFRSLERTTEKLLVEPHRLRAHYLQQYGEFCTQLARRCVNVRVDYQKLVTNVPYDVALGAFLDARSRHKGKM